MSIFSNYNLDSGNGLKDFLEASGLIIKGSSGLEGSQNIIKLNDLTSFNWKSSENAIRVNCKEHAMNCIEAKTDLQHFDNGSGDPTRPYSFFIRSLANLIDVIYILKRIDGNS